MKYGVLREFRDYLKNEIPNKNTADSYFFSVSKIFKNIQFESLEEIEPKFLEEELSKLKTKNSFSSAKNGLLHLAQFNDSLRLPEQQFFKETSLKKRNWSKKPPKTIYLDTVNRKVNALKNKKLKLAFRLMKVSGLRVSELAALEKEDIQINNGQVMVNVRHGKGGSNGLVKCLPDSYLAKELDEYLKSSQEQGAIFYSAATMKRKAVEMGIECHDFRRIAAITHNKAEKSKPDTNKDTANESTKEFLRHVRFSTTKRYLYNRKLKLKNPIDAENERSDNNGKEQ